MVIAAIVPQFFSTDIERTLTYYRNSLGFERQFEYGVPAFYAGAVRDRLSIFFRHVDNTPPRPTAKDSEELLDVYIRVDDAAALYDEYAERNVAFHRPLAPMPWGFREFVVKDLDGRLLCFGEPLDPANG